jgi:PPK2 family polyphosphate:nucleotide phosphotransferase
MRVFSFRPRSVRELPGLRLVHMRFQDDERVLSRMTRQDFATRYRIESGKKFHLKEIDPRDTGDINSKEAAAPHLEEGVTRLCELQEKLSAQGEWSLLLIFQAMDAAGKDGAIKHVLSGVNPQGCKVTSWKKPSDEELSHDFLWRASKALPEAGRIGVLNRSYYEEVLMVRVHPDYLENQHIPKKLITKRIWRERFQSINDFERHLTRSGTVVLKFLLHLSPEEQRRRILERIDDKEKNWKFEINDLAERKLWDRYMDAFQEMVRETATAEAPWHVVPADHKWFTHLVVSSIIIDKLRSLHLHLPKLSAKEKKQMAKARAQLAGGRAK